MFKEEDKQIKIYSINSDLKIKADARIQDYANIVPSGSFKRKQKIALTLIENIKNNLQKLRKN